MSKWARVAETPPPVDQMVLLSWGSEEGSQAGYRRTNEHGDFYCIGGDTSDGDDPEWWMPFPPLPSRKP